MYLLPDTERRELKRLGLTERKALLLCAEIDALTDAIQMARAHPASSFSPLAGPEDWERLGLVVGRRGKEQRWRYSEFEDPVLEYVNVVEFGRLEDCATCATIEWSDASSDRLTTLGIGAALWHRTDLQDEKLWFDWCFSTDNAHHFSIERMLEEFYKSAPTPLLWHFHAEVFGDYQGHRYEPTASA